MTGATEKIVKKQGRKRKGSSNGNVPNKRPKETETTEKMATEVKTGIKNTRDGRSGPRQRPSQRKATKRARASNNRSKNQREADKAEKMKSV